MTKQLSIQSPLTSRAAVLQSLAKGESYGLEILDKLEKRSGKRVRFYQGSIYPILRSLEDEGLLASRAVKAEDATKTERKEGKGGRPRVYYRLTKAGRRAALKNRLIVLSFYKSKSKSNGKTNGKKS
jgi:DNA-binding PadR family transcriptional regulator